jgi:hypothetical protein
VLALRNTLGTWILLEQLRDRLGHHALCEILDYQATLDIQDATCDVATITRRRVIHFLHDNVVAIHDHAWGDGELLRGASTNREFRLTSTRWVQTQGADFAPGNQKPGRWFGASDGTEMAGRFPKKIEPCETGPPVLRWSHVLTPPRRR